LLISLADQIPVGEHALGKASTLRTQLLTVMLQMIVPDDNDANPCPFWDFLDALRNFLVGGRYISETRKFRGFDDCGRRQNEGKVQEESQIWR
jgi:hypothetical protein